jgi:hypothetical protein
MTKGSYLILSDLDGFCAVSSFIIAIIMSMSMSMIMIMISVITHRQLAQLTTRLATTENQ